MKLSRLSSSTIFALQKKWPKFCPLSRIVKSSNVKPQLTSTTMRQGDCVWRYRDRCDRDAYFFNFRTGTSALALMGVIPIIASSRSERDELECSIIPSPPSTVSLTALQHQQPTVKLCGVLQNEAPQSSLSTNSPSDSMGDRKETTDKESAYQEVNELSDVKVFSGSGSQLMATEICALLGTTLGRAHIETKDDGETTVEFLDHVRGKDVFLVQSAHGPKCHDQVMELLLMIAALKRASARCVVAVVPYLAYARQTQAAAWTPDAHLTQHTHLSLGDSPHSPHSLKHSAQEVKQSPYSQEENGSPHSPHSSHSPHSLHSHHSPHSPHSPYSPHARGATVESLDSPEGYMIKPIAAADLILLLDSVGVDGIIFVDLHNPRTAGFYPGLLKILNVEPQQLAVKYLRRYNLVRPVIVSTEHTGTERAKLFWKKMGEAGYEPGLATVVSNRPERIRQPEGLTPLDHARPELKFERKDGDSGEEHRYLVGDVYGRDCVIVDDILDTAVRSTNAAELLQKAGARNIYYYATHGLFSKGAVERLNNSPIKAVITTNTVTRPPHIYSHKVQTLSLSKLLAESIRRLHLHEPVSDLFNEGKHKRTDAAERRGRDDDDDEVVEETIKK
eukprot:GHVN01039236.1.p1 GENE.GHVN01039236.1~~GHVN01039236.1.p1  ORF type:complete len:618 (-),score=174.85 GHVN01039236.1:139-1992(-)